jgi:mRNA-degrading endonuclease RelE of RelBE toxin-antitoxin system
VTFHPAAAKELAKFDKPAQKQIAATIDALAAGAPNLQTHDLRHPLKGWYATKASKGHRIVHRVTDDGTLHIGSVNLHDYRAAERRLSAQDGLEHLRRAGYNTDGWDKWQQGKCGTYACALIKDHPHMRLGVMGHSFDPEDGEGWSTTHYFAHDDTHAYDSAGKHKLPYHGIDGSADIVEHDHDPEGWGLPDEEHGSPGEQEQSLADASAHARRHGIVEGRFSKTANLHDYRAAERRLSAAEAPKTYLRFGDWPADERSTNNVTGHKEEGVSVYDLDHHGHPMDPDPDYSRGHEHDEYCDDDCDMHLGNDDFGNDTHEEMQGRAARAERNRYNGNDRPSETGHLVTGEHVGFGHDNEPLLNNVKRVGDWIDHKHMFFPGSKPHRLARDPEDEDYEPPKGLRRRANQQDGSFADIADEAPEEEIIAHGATDAEAMAGSGGAYDDGTEWDEDGRPADGSKKAVFNPYSMIVEAASDPEFKFHVTAAWADVRRKAKRIRSEGKVRITLASDGLVFGEVQGDHHTYETGVQRFPGSKHSVATYTCGCKWGAYHWGANDDFSRFAGRMCSHALALQYEAQSRGMFGRDVTEDSAKPEWVPHKVVLRYDIDSGDNQMVRSSALRAELEQWLSKVAQNWDDPEPNMWDMHDEDGSYAQERQNKFDEWDNIHEGLGDIHRGVNVHLRPEDHDIVHDQSRPMHERAQHLLKSLPHSDLAHGNTGLGTHWTDNHGVAESFGEMGSRPNRHGTHPTSVVFHAEKPDRDAIDENPDETKGMIYGYHDHGESEIPLRPGAGVHLKGVSWKNMNTPDEDFQTFKGDGLFDHLFEHQRHNFPGGQYHSATLEVTPLVALAQWSQAQGDDPEEFAFLAATCGIDLSASVNGSPWGEPVPEAPHYTPGPTKPRNASDNPGSTGWANQGDPDNWNSINPNDLGDRVAAYQHGQPLYHGTSQAFQPGDTVEPSYELGGRKGSSWAFATSDPDVAHNYAKHKAWAAGMFDDTVRPHAYEVRPTGPVEEDDTVQDHFRAYRTRHPMEVVREIHPHKEASIPQEIAQSDDPLGSMPGTEDTPLENGVTAAQEGPPRPSGPKGGTGGEMPPGHPGMPEHQELTPGAEATLNMEPEGALPFTDGEAPDLTDDESLTPSRTASAEAVEGIVAAFQATAAHLAPGGSSGPSAGGSDIAQAARDHLAKTALKDYSAAEQAAIINEGTNVRAANLDRLDIADTHYAALEEDEDPTWP